jgi:hypothetical protein
MLEKVIHTNIKRGCHFINKLSYHTILENGKFYYPAWSHYNKVVIVVCYKCGKSELKACIGFDNYDLCITCVEELTKSYSYELPSDRYSPYAHIN